MNHLDSTQVQSSKFPVNDEPAPRNTMSQNIIYSSLCTQVQAPQAPPFDVSEELEGPLGLRPISKTANCLATLGVLVELGALAKHSKIVQPLLSYADCCCQLLGLPDF